MPIHKPLGQKGAHAEAFGRSRGGFTSKIHARCDNQGRPLGFVLIGGQVSDYKAVNTLLELPTPNPRAILADRGYDNDSFRHDLLIHGILPVIPSRKGRSVPQKQTGDVTGTATASSVCSTTSSRCAASRPATTRLPYPS
ncbi:transposase [Gluconobacter wancherniae]|uniref:transposase n=1 Tax=Gluconobacter wancherniae TaxID=1307955 RepID=UPI0038D22720